MSALDLRSLRTFIAVVDAGSLSKASAALYVAQPALTAQIKKLEGELAAQLLERSHTGVTPTPIGLQLYQDGRRLLHLSTRHGTLEDVFLSLTGRRLDEGQEAPAA